MKFSAVVDEWVLKSERRMDAIMKQSAQEVINEAQTPVAKGGHMRVDTGFLRASGSVSLNGLPSGPSRPAAPGGTYEPADISLEIAKAKLGDTIFFGWVANYARAREAKDGFARLAAQNWSKIVARVTAQAKARIK